MSVQSEINRLATAKTAIGTAISGKGVAVPSGTKLDGMAALIDGIEAGGEDVSAETAEYTELLTDLETAIDALPEAGGGGGGSGGSVETCSVQIRPTSGVFNTLAYTTVDENGKLYGVYTGFVSPAGTTIVCACGTILTVASPVGATISVENSDILSQNLYGMENVDAATVCVVHITAAEGETVIIT